MSMRYSSCGVAILLAIALSASARADQSGSTTLGANASLNLDTGEVSNIGGDILWNGSALVPQGRAGLFNLGKYGSRVFKFIPAGRASSAPYSATPIPARALVEGDVFGVHTNRGNYAKVMVTAANGASLSLEYKTFLTARSPVRIATTGGGPIITNVQNNYSYLLPGVPNYGIAPGSLFVIIGSGLSSSTPPVLQSSAAPGLPLKLNQTSVSVNVGSVTTTPALYYTSANQLAAVLPSTTPVGNGVITVTYNGQSSAATPIQVVASALGLDTLYGTGTGLGIATDANGNVLGLTNSAMPGQTIILWGSGVGADTSNDDRTFPQNQDNLTNIPMQVYIGGISANVAYHGRSQYPGVDQINVVIPNNVSFGCYVSVVAQSGSVVSNAVTLPVSQGGGACSDTGLGYTGSQLQALAASGSTPVKSAALAVAQFTNGDGTVGSIAVAGFSSFNSSEFGAGYAYASQGSCTVSAPGFSFNNLGVGAGAALDAGTIQVTGPFGSQMTLQEQGGGGLYAAQLSMGALLTGTYTFSTSGGKDVKAFNQTLIVPPPFAVTNGAALATITRSQGATVTWTGGFPNGDIVVTGLSSAPAGSVSFYCYAPSSAGQLTIPSSILLALPPGSNKLNVLNFTSPQTVPGVSFSLATAIVGYTIPYTLK
jgi:uncharacterized protein (TIGR03437 family)